MEYKIGTNYGFWLTLLFIGLKLTHQIDWSWWWVLSPLWLGVAFILLILVIVAIAALITEVVERS
jgi:hypothetical protein